MVEFLVWFVGFFVCLFFGALVFQGLPLLVGAIVEAIVSLFVPPREETAGERQARLIADRRKNSPVAGVKR
jgi:hypothetical protein